MVKCRYLLGLVLVSVLFAGCLLGDDIDTLREKAGIRSVISINSQPSEIINVTEGNISGNLSVSASVTGGAALNYQWYSNTTNSNTGGSVINGATSSSYAIPTTLTTGTYYYFCQVSAVGGVATPVRSNVSRVDVIPSPFPMEMVWVQGGSFELGRELNPNVGGGDYTPVSTVNISGFNMGKYQVTQAQYQAVMGNNPSYFSNNPASGEIQSRRPVETVSWYDAIVFCNRLSIREGLTIAYRIPSIAGSSNNEFWESGSLVIPTSNNAAWNAIEIISDSTGYRLPTEAQWEYAAKGGNGSPGNFTYSGSNDPNAVAWYSANSGSRTHEVGKKAPNILGLYDMSGNVWEWCWDWWGNYTSNTKNDPLGAPSGSLRVIRGGFWYFSSENVRSVNRYVNDPFI